MEGQEGGGSPGLAMEISKGRGESPMQNTISETSFCTRTAWTAHKQGQCTPIYTI